MRSPQRTPLAMIGALSLLFGLASCVARVSGAYGLGYFDTQRCYWTWVDDTFGGFEQLHCWNPSYGGYYPYVQGGVNVRRYPGWYTGQRVVVAPPPVTVVRPPGVTIVPAPRAPRVPFAVPAPPARTVIVP